jgi:MscS family membrane protein
MKKLFVIFMLLCLAQLQARAQAIVDYDYNLSSPYNTLATHINNLENKYRPEVAAKTFQQKQRSAERAEELAIKLMQIYKGAGIFINFDDLPTNPDYFDSLTRKHRYYISPRYPEIFLEKVGGQWFYSQHTATEIDRIHQSVYPLGIDNLLNVLPKMGTQRLFGLHLWQLVTLLAIIFLSILIHKLFTLLLERFIMQLLISQGYRKIAKEYIAPVARPISILILFPILLALVPVLQLSFTVNNYILIFLKAMWPLFATIVFYRLVDVLGAYMTRMAERTRSTLDDQLVPLMRKALKIFVIIVGGLAILANLDIDIIPLLTGLSIGGLAFALAAQDTLKNFFGSVMIFLDKPFQIGDWITSGDIDGTVEEVGFRATRIRTFRNSVTYVPNGILASTNVDNHGLRIYRRFTTTIAVTYDTPADLVNIFVEGLRKIVEEHPLTRKDFYHVYLNDLGARSLDIMFYIFFAVPTWGEELRCRHEILVEVIKLAEGLGVNFAFPTQTLHVETFPEKKGNSPQYLHDQHALRQRLEEYMGKSKDWENQN